LDEQNHSPNFGMTFVQGVFVKPEKKNIQPYVTDQEYLADVMDLLKIKLCRSWQSQAGTRAELLQKNEAFSITASVFSLSSQEQPSEEQLQQAISADEAKQKLIESRLEKTRGENLKLPSALQLKQKLGLTESDMDIILILLGRQIDHQLREILGEFHSWRGSVKVWNIIFALGGQDPQVFSALWERFLPDAPLRKWNIIHADDREYDQLRTDIGPVPDLKIYLSQTVADFLMGMPHVSRSIQHCTTRATPGVDERKHFLTPEVIGAIDSVLKRYTDDIESTVTQSHEGVEKNGATFYIVGQPGSGRQTLGISISSKLGKPLLIFDCSNFLDDDLKSQLAIPTLFRDARLLDATVFFHNSQILMEDDAKLSHIQQLIVQTMSDMPGIVFIGSEQPISFDSEVQTKIAFRISLEIPTIQVREKYWQYQIEKYPAIISDDVDIRRLARYHPFHIGSIRSAVLSAIDEWLTSGEKRRLELEDLLRVCRYQMNKKMAYMASRVEAKPTWDSLILPEETKSVLMELVVFGRHKVSAFEEWGFSKRITTGKGLGCLFFGDPGTGKSMAAGIIARELGKELFKVNIAKILSKWIGETEKNLDKVFREAQESSSIILFDEADALFGKRHSDIQSSTDRYANLEVNYLLSKLEEFEGIAILTTNKKSIMDEAFMRRLNFRVFFPFPDQDYRTKLWQSMIPATAPIRGKVDYEYLAKKYFRLPGGNIKNAVMRAAVMALSEGGMIDTRYLDLAAEKECRETGALWKVEMTITDQMAQEQALLDEAEEEEIENTVSKKDLKPEDMTSQEETEDSHVFPER
jgi:ATP-dependent 26S proteasome regulatory subunit